MSHRLQVLIPEELDIRIRKAAQRGRISKGEWVRRAIEGALRSPETKGIGKVRYWRDTVQAGDAD